ncbi:hypothetical protein CPLU01_12188 [Colletotrichum plurivorum]|uniref:Uncharacterized protein n=1 Tax=Colletotrichum plurivorum TaxID=2175906 RepID=A0A8H6N766_9PEZI|nr:hypothetical protein CPLU01_12188 [Colletotrichum plurivorum]
MERKGVFTGRSKDGLTACQRESTVYTREKEHDGSIQPMEEAVEITDNWLTCAAPFARPPLQAISTRRVGGKTLERDFGVCGNYETGELHGRF